jgi:uncharacterized lipoprotein YddW (UPF0748 family)
MVWQMVSRPRLRAFHLEARRAFPVNAVVIRFLLIALLTGIGLKAAAPYVPSSAAPPPVAREFRGAWVASVKNIDWPSKPGLTTAQQKQELLAILDRCQQLKLNVVVLQVRPACDALYPSKLEPWSEYITGVQGQAPSPLWDPLEFAVQEAHQRGLELHAWFNPFRARHTLGFSALSRDHISKTQPAWVKTYGTQLWLDPGLPEARDYAARVILDVVRRYDIDGIHIDDYFYPYREKDSSKKDIPFPDWTSWGNYQKAGGKLSRDDWRRSNVNRFVERIYRDVKVAKPWVRVGISPFGIYRPGFPAQVRGMDQYETIYADPRAWLANGWLDYLAPQLYWRIDAPQQSFPALLKWWAENNPKQRLIVAGMNTYNVGAGAAPWPASEITRQVELARKQPGAGGHLHWNMSALMKNRGGLTDELARSTYRQLALVPALGHIVRLPAPSLQAATNGNGARFDWSLENTSDVRFWLLQTRRGTNWNAQVLSAQTRGRNFENPPDAVAVSAMDRFGQLGEARTLTR